MLEVVREEFGVCFEGGWEQSGSTSRGVCGELMMRLIRFERRLAEARETFERSLIRVPQDVARSLNRLREGCGMYLGKSLGRV